MPKIQRVIWRIVPSAGSRRALRDRGDADTSFDLPPKDMVEMTTDKKLTVISTLIGHDDYATTWGHVSCCPTLNTTANEARWRLAAIR